METDLIQAVADYTEAVMGQESFRYISAVVATCKMLALELDDATAGALNNDVLIISAYLHNISTMEFGFEEHQVKSAEMAADFLRSVKADGQLVTGVKQTILAHTTVVPSDERATLPLEARVLYDADKLGRLSGLAVVTSLIEFGARYPNRAVNGEVLSAILRHIEERFVDLFQSLNTDPAREMARVKFGNTLAFLDGVIEHLTDATPI